MNFFLGCAVWAYKGWVGHFYPSGSRATEFLQLYSQRFTAVEGNTTFYSAPSSANIAHWVAQTPTEFKFCLKLPRHITHNGLLQPSVPGAWQFLKQIRGLGERLGPVFAQLPPSYKPEFLDDLTAFLNAWPHSEVPLALEVRHPDWFKPPYDGKLTAILEDRGVGRVLLDTRPVYSESSSSAKKLKIRKPKLPLQPIITSSFSLIRLISHPEQELNQSFMEEWVTLVNQWLCQGTSIYFFVHCPVEERSPENALNFQQMLEQHGAPVPPLPWNNVPASPIQLDLFL